MVVIFCRFGRSPFHSVIASRFGALLSSAPGGARITPDSGGPPPGSARSRCLHSGRGRWRPKPEAPQVTALLLGVGDHGVGPADPQQFGWAVCPECAQLDGVGSSDCQLKRLGIEPRSSEERAIPPPKGEC